MSFWDIKNLFSVKSIWFGMCRLLHFFISIRHLDSSVKLNNNVSIEKVNNYVSMYFFLLFVHFLRILKSSDNSIYYNPGLNLIWVLVEISIEISMRYHWEIDKKSWDTESSDTDHVATIYEAGMFYFALGNLTRL